VGDGPAEGPGLGPLDVDVDPLVVAGGVGEEVHGLLGDEVRLGRAELGPHQVLEAVDALHGRGHAAVLAERLLEP
jgi:hypothetical protein